MSNGKVGKGILGVLRAVALIVLVPAAIGSVASMLPRGQRAPRFLVVLFTIWVLAPFVALAWANLASKPWSAFTRATLGVVTLVVALASWAIYGDVLPFAPPGAPNAFVFVVVPAASWVVMAGFVPLAALLSGRRLRRDGGA